jgi:hypothetical protein
MVEYTYGEGLELLQKNLRNTETSLDSIKEDVSFLKDQITTAEVG